MGEGAPDPSERVRDAGDRRRPRRLAPAGPDGGPVPPIRDRQVARRPDRLRGHARADDRADRGRRHDRREVRDRYRWFSVDEYQDTNPLQAALLDAWLGGREDLAVVGDEDQTIYTFTGATSDYLIGFTERYPSARVVRLETNYRSTPEVLALANRVLAAGRVAADERLPGVAPRPPKRLVASLAPGPEPEIGGFATDEAELAGMTAAIRALGRAGTAHGAIAILVRTNAQLPAIEGALGAAGIPFHVRGERFFARPEVRRAMRVAGALARVSSEEPLVARLSAAFERELGVRRDTIPEGEAAAERHGAVVTLLELAEDLARTDPAADVPAFLAEVERRAEIEAGGTATGVELLTYHRAKGLEWDAVFLPALEEGTLPIRQSTEPDELAEERRLLYVGITRARRYLWLSWATSRTAATGRGGRRSRSRFLDGLGAAVGPPARGRRECRTPRGGPAARPEGRPGRPVAALECAPCLAHGPCPRRRRRAVHRLPRLDDRGHRGTPPALDRGAAPRPRRRSDEARSLRRGDHRGRRPRGLGADFLAHERDVRKREADDGQRHQRHDLGPHQQDALVEGEERRDLLRGLLCLAERPRQLRRRVAARVEQDGRHLGVELAGQQPADELLGLRLADLLLDGRSRSTARRPAR